jgi:membrane protein YqaA with SNARE-associated domain
MKSRVGSILIRILSLAAVIAISVYIFAIRDQAQELAVYGYPGIFLLAFLAYATVLLPAPGVAVVFTMGAIFHPLGVALAAGAGAALGELVGYAAGFSGQNVAARSKFYDKLEYWMKKNGSLTVLIMSAIPNPLFDLAGAAAGVLKMPLLRFLFWCWLGETIKMTLFAFGGLYSIHWLLPK